MNSLPFANHRFMQFCWIVPDLKEGIEQWARTTGVGPFWWIDEVVFEEGYARGRPSPFPDVTAAMSQAGDVQIELIAYNDDGPSFFHDLIPRGKSGLHHAAIYTSDYDADLAAYTQNGAEVAYSGRIWGDRTCWIDTSATIGFMIELLETSEARDRGFAVYRESAENWDGKDPIRYFD